MKCELREYEQELKELGVFSKRALTKKFNEGKEELKTIGIFSKEELLEKTIDMIKEDNLAKWCEEQKRAYRNGELEQSKIDKLESLEYWTWN